MLNKKVSSLKNAFNIKLTLNCLWFFNAVKAFQEVFRLVCIKHHELFACEQAVAAVFSRDPFDQWGGGLVDGWADACGMVCNGSN